MCGSNCITLEREEKVSDKAVEVEIRRFLKVLKDSKTKKVNILDLLVKFSYPSHQIERVMERLEKEGIVKEGF